MCLTGAALLTLGLIMVPSIASSEGVIVLHGSNGPSHPRFSVQGSELVLLKDPGNAFRAR
jgi:hypothetical protein